MLKKLFISLIIVIAALSVNAQSTFNKGDKALNIGIGLGWGYAGGYGSFSTFPLPSFNASFEAGLFDLPNVGVISIGGFGSFRTTWDSGAISGYDYDYTYNNTILAARGVFHFGFFDTGAFDLYAGIHSGVRISSYTYTSDFYNESDGDTDFVHDVFVGARYMKSSKFGFFAEAGYGISYLKVGLAFKF